MSENIYQGEITLVKIDDGANAPSYKFIDYYQLTSNSKAPNVPPTTTNKSEFASLLWFLKDELKSNIGNDTPYLWTFRRTEYSDGTVEHGPAIIASFWATAPQVQARYSADSKPPWEENYDSIRHNYIIFSYDDGQTWGPFINGVTDLENGIGGIRIKGRVEVDEAAIIYKVETSQDDLLRYVNYDRVTENFSPSVLSIWATKEYLNIIDRIAFIDPNTEGEYEKDESGSPIYPENSFIPILSCALRAGEQKIDITEQLEELEVDESIELLKYNYSTNNIEFNFEGFYNIIKSKTKDGTLEDHLLAPIFALFSNNELELILKLTLIGNGKNIESEKRISIRFASTLDLARFSVEANAIVQSIRNSSLTFNVDGLTVRNGGLKILQSKYNFIDKTGRIFEAGKFYKQIIEDNVLKYEIADEKDFNNSETLLYELEEEAVLEANQSGGITIKGNGSFSGAIYADSGEFKGRIKAESGFLEDLDINGTLTILGGEVETGHPNLYLSGLYRKTKDEYRVQDKTYYYYDENIGAMNILGGTSLDHSDTVYEKNDMAGIRTSNFTMDGEAGFYLDPATSTIYAKQIKIGSKAEIEDKIHFPGSKSDKDSNYDAYIYNPKNPKNEEGRKHLFIETKKDNVSTLKIYADGRIQVGNKGVIIDGTSSSIKSENFLTGASGWCISGDSAEFNNITARGTLRSVVMEYDKVSTIGGCLLVRPSAPILDAVIEDGQAILTLDIDKISFNNNTENDTENNTEPYYFRIGTSKNLYVLVTESKEKEEEKKQVTIRRLRGEFTEGMVNSFIGEVLIGYGKTGDIGIGINSQESSAAMPPEAISVFETGAKEIDDLDDYQLDEKCKIVLGQLNKSNVEELWGSTDTDVKYGLIADQVFVKGALISSSDDLNSGIDSYSQALSKRFTKKIISEGQEKEEATRILLWAGAPADKSRNEAPFQVDECGNLLALHGHFEGSINASEITASVLKTATLMGMIDEDGEQIPALKITNAEKAIQFITIDQNNIEKVALDLDQNGMKLGVPIIFDDSGSRITKDEVYSPRVKIGEKLYFSDSKFLLKTEHQEKSGIFFGFNDNDTEEVTTSMLSNEIQFHTNAYLNESVYFGEGAMEYRKAEEEVEVNGVLTTKIIGYDLYIES